jgi:putative membrane protein
MIEILRLTIAAILVATSGFAVAETQKPAAATAKDFALMASQADEFEILTGLTAAVQAVDPRVRSFAQQMVDDHSRDSRALVHAATASGLQPPPSALSSDQAVLLGALQSLRGPDFDRTYLRQQLLAHDQALAVEQNFADGGTDANLRFAAQAAVPTIQQHLQMAQSLRDAIGCERI